MRTISSSRRLLSCAWMSGIWRRQSLRSGSRCRNVVNVLWRVLMPDKLRPEWLPWVTEDGEVKLIKIWTGLAELVAAGAFDGELAPQARNYIDSLPEATGTFEGELM